MTMAQRTTREVEAILTDHSPGPQTSWVTCTGCQARGEVTDTEHLSDADVAARLSTMGWIFAGWTRWLCAECSATPKIHSRIMDQSPSDQAMTGRSHSVTTATMLACLPGLSAWDYLDQNEQQQRGRAVRAEMRAEEVAAERDALAAKLAAVEDALTRVRALHAPYYPLRGGHPCCAACEGDEFAPYPCATIRTLDGEADQ